MPCHSLPHTCWRYDTIFVITLHAATPLLLRYYAAFAMPLLLQAAAAVLFCYARAIRHAAIDADMILCAAKIR